MENNQINLFGKIIDGKIKIENSQALNDWAKLQKEGDTIVFRLTNSKDFRTIRQLRLLYKCFRAISEHTGYTIEEIKLLLKQKAGLFFTHSIENKDYTVIKSVGDMSSKEISNFIEFVDRWSSQTLNCPLLTHDDLNFLKNE